MADLRAIIVTGAAGFVGRAVVELLINQGATVVSTDTVAHGMSPGARTVVGDLGSRALRDEVLGDGCQAIIHLATVPGGAAEANPAESRRINVDAMYDLMLEASAAVAQPRFVFASSIAVFGDTLPALVDDATPLSPRLVYGGHKAMMEDAIALFSNRGLIDGCSLRLPGILARPAWPSGLKSAFMSDLFHALRAGARFVCPVSSDATIWAQSVDCVARNLIHALSLDSALLPITRAVTLPALRMTMGALAAEIAHQCGVSADLVDYVPDVALELAFGAQPPLVTPAAERARFTHDGDLTTLVSAALATISKPTKKPIRYILTLSR